MAKISNSKSARNEAERKLFDGSRKHLPKSFFLIVNRRRYTRRQLVGLMAERVEMADDIARLRTAYRAAIRADESRRAETDVVAAALRHAILTMCGTSPTVLAEFGLSPRKERRRRTAPPAAAPEKQKTELTRPAGAARPQPATNGARNGAGKPS